MFTLFIYVLVFFELQSSLVLRRKLLDKAAGMGKHSNAVEHKLDRQRRQQNAEDARDDQDACAPDVRDDPVTAAHRRPGREERAGDRGGDRDQVEYPGRRDIYIQNRGRNRAGASDHGYSERKDARIITPCRISCDRGAIDKPVAPTRSGAADATRETSRGATAQPPRSSRSAP